MAGEPIERIATESAIAPVAAETTIVSDAPDQAIEQEASLLSARPQWSWIVVLAGALIITLVTSIALFVSGASDRLQAALFPPTATPTADVMNTATLPPTPDLAPTFDFLSTQVAAGVDAALATRDVLATANAPTPTLTPSPIPDLTATAFAACKLDMEIVNDYGVQPDPVPPGDLFIKRWTIRNTGTCSWPSGVQLTFKAGDEIEITSASEIEPIAPAEIGEIEVTLSAPARPDKYTSVLRLQDDLGNQIGDELTIAFRVELPPTPRPTATPAPSPTPESTPMPREALWMSIPGITWCDSGKAGGRVEWGKGGGSSDEYRYFQGGVSPENELSGSYNEFMGFPHVATYFTTSGELAFPIPDECCPGDYGSYVSPDGYEIVWNKVWLPIGNCPD
jgi:hypothetical protein